MGIAALHPSYVLRYLVWRAAPAQELVTTERFPMLFQPPAGVKSCGRSQATVRLPRLKTATGCLISATAFSGRWRVDHDNVGWIAYLDAVIPDIENARRAICNHVKAFGQLVG
jgi:hypothetical protein